MRDIAGWVSYENNRPDMKNEFISITKSMTRSTHDRTTVWMHDHIGLGARATADAPQSSSTLASEPDSLAIGYCGTPDTTDLLDKLHSHGHNMSHRTVAETLMKGYQIWQEKLATLLDGKFVMAAWDVREKKLTLIRDRCGNQPIYYYRTEDGLIFGTEIRIVLSSRLAKKDVDVEGFRELLLPLVHNPGSSVWKGLYEVEPGTLLVLDPNGVHTESYWKLPARAHDDNLADTIMMTRTLLESSVLKHINSGNKVHVLLSGGLDSSTITSTAATLLAQRGKGIRTCSVDVISQVDDFQKVGLQDSWDSPYVDEMVRFANTIHTRLTLDPRELADLEYRQHLTHSTCMPVISEMTVSLYLLLETIHGDDSTALSGNGADGLFGGMPHFYDDNLIENLTNPSSLALSQVESTCFDWLSPEIFQKLDVYTYIADQHSSEISSVETLDDESDYQRRNRILFNVLLRIMGRILGKRDHNASKSAQVELHSPFSDYKLVEYIYNAPWSFKYFDGKEKSLLRRAARGILPESIIYRKKSGYPTTTQFDSYAQKLLEQAEAIAAERNHPVFDIVNRKWLEGMVHNTNSRISFENALNVDRAIGIYYWLELFRPTLSLA